jgi:hypothetical protein
MAEGREKTKKGAAPDPEAVAEALSNSMLKDMVSDLEETKLKLLLVIGELKDKLAMQKDDQVHTCIHIYIHACIHTFTHTCTCTLHTTYTNTYILLTLMHTYTHTYIHTHTE